MKLLILKKLGVFLFMSIFLISSAVNTNADWHDLIDSLNQDEVKIILRALNHKCQVNWERDFRLNTSNRREKTRKVLEFLNAVYTEREKKLDREQLCYLTNFYAEREKTLNPEELTQLFSDSGKAFRTEQWQKKKDKLELGRGQLKGLLNNSDHTDFLTFECLSTKTIAIEGAEDFVILDSGAEELISREVRFEQSALTLNEELTAVLDLLTSEPAPVSSSSIPTPIPLISISASVSPPASSILPDDTTDEAEVLLLMLDEKSVKLTLHARLNDYRIPFNAFHFSIPEEKERCTKVVNYLNLMLERKLGKILDKQTKFPPDSPSWQFYHEKYTQYGRIHNIMWDLFTEKINSSPATY